MIAGIMQTRNYSDQCKAFQTLRRLCDYVIVLDDNSSSMFPYANDCDVYLQQRTPNITWNCTGNLTLLYYQAFVLGCEWVLRLDDDMMFGAEVQMQEDVKKILTEADMFGVNKINFVLRDLWDGKQTYRCDGRWGRKKFPVLNKNWFFDENITLERATTARLHQAIYPTNKAQRLLELPIPVYHAGNMTHTQRLARFEKYSRLDPTHQFQDDYSYITNIDGIAVAEVPTEDVEFLFV